MQGLATATNAAMLSRQVVRRQHPLAASASIVRMIAQQQQQQQRQQQRTYATPSGPPSKGFRMARTPRWDEEKESTFDRAGKFFLMTEMFRGMYVALEQYFRPP